MSKTVDEIYLDVAKAVVESIDQPWQVAILNFEYTDDSGEFDCVFREEGGNEQDFDVDFLTYKNFKELHLIMTKDGSNRWNRAKFTLYPSGKFNIDFEWDQSLADEIDANS